MTNIDIDYPCSDIYHQVDLLSYYRGESVKRDDPNADIPQTSDDQRDILAGFLATACNQVVALCARRMSEAAYSCADGTVHLHLATTGDGDEQRLARLLPPLRQALFDFLANFTLYRWLLAVRAEWAQSFQLQLAESQELLSSLLFSLYDKRPRLRCTDLGGI